MAPITQLPMRFPLLSRSYDGSVDFQFSQQWSNPSDILSILLLVGGDVIQRAIAQQSGHLLPTPVVFSFGWVAYAFTALLSVFGEGKLMPTVPDTRSFVINGKSGHVRENSSWIIGRVLRDFESSWAHEKVEAAIQAAKDAAFANGFGVKEKVGLCISIYEADRRKVHKWDRESDYHGHYDAWFFSGYVVALIQLAIAVLPLIFWGAWDTFMIASVGTVLAFCSGWLPQWRRERWSCDKKSKQTFILTRGNGAQHALVIRGCGKGLDLEQLAAYNETVTASVYTKALTGLLTLLWVALLITVCGIGEHTWFLVAIGAIGMVHTVLVAGVPRKPEVLGMPLKFKQVIMHHKVKEALKELELAYPGDHLGSALLPVFFPGCPAIVKDHSRPGEKEEWDDVREKCRKLSDKLKELEEESKKLGRVDTALSEATTVGSPLSRQTSRHGLLAWSPSRSATIDEEKGMEGDGGGDLGSGRYRDWV